MSLDTNPQNLLYRLDALERGLISINREINTQSRDVQDLREQVSNQVEYGHQNYLRNGDLDFTRNTYLYATDYSDADPNTVDADVSEEAAYWYVSEPDTAVEDVGNISASDQTLFISKASATFDDPADVGAAIVVEGAGAGGADLVTTIASVTNNGEAELTDAASTTVADARVRWRLMELKEDSTDEDADADQTTNNALKTENHSRYNDSGIINDPDFDKANGWVRLSSENWLCAPLPQNYFKPSKSYIVSFIYRLASQIDGADTYDAELMLGLWDNTAGRRMFLEGGKIGLNASVVGAPAGTVSREYFVVFYTGWGETIGTEKVTVANAPDDASFITNQVYVALSWTQPRGVVKTEVYRKTGTDYHLISLPYPQSATRDAGAVIRTETDYPAVDYTRPRAFLKSTPASFPPPRYNVWQRAQFHLVVPHDYDMSKTTGQQWFVLGLQSALSGTGSERALEIDLFSIDDKYGTFTRSPLDFLAKRNVSSNPTSGNQGNTGTGEPPILPNDCVALGAAILVENRENHTRYEVPAWKLCDSGDFLIVNRSGQAVEYKARITARQAVYRLTTSGGKQLTASATHPVFTATSDVVGKPLSSLEIGDKILVRGEALEQVVSNVRLSRLQYTVRIEISGDDKGFWADGIGGHNRKYHPDGPPQV